MRDSHVCATSTAAVRLAAAVGLGLLTWGCQSEGETTTPLALADAPEATVSLARDVQPLLDANCVCCHSAEPTCWPPPAAAFMTLEAGTLYEDDPATPVDGIVGVPSSYVPGLVRVVPGDPDGSYLVHKVQGTQLEAGGVGARMPLGGSPLSDSEIDLIRTWIAQGALDN